MRFVFAECMKPAIPERSCVFAAVFPAMLFLFFQSAPAQGGAWSAEFDQPGLGLEGVPYALCNYRGELVAGTRKPFSSDGQPSPMNYVGHFDGVRWLPFGTGVSGIVHAAIAWNDDLYVGGSFRYAGGKPASSIARWDGKQWWPVGDGFDGEVRALAVFQNKLHAAGAFGLSGSQPMPRIAVFDSGKWTAVGGGIHRQVYKPEVRCLLVAGGKLYAGGSFDKAGTTAASNVAVWDGKSWLSLGGGINPTGTQAIVASLASFGTKIIAGGSFARAGATATRNIAAWDGKAWTRLGEGLTNATYLAVVESLMEYGGALYAGGTFIWVGEDTSPSAIPVHRFAKWDGSKWSSVGGVTEGLYLPNLIATMTVHDGRLWVGGDFTIAGKDPLPASGFVSRFVASFDGKDWGSAGRGLGLDRSARRLVAWQNGIVAVGGFTQAGEAPARSVAFFDGARWRSLGTFDNQVFDAVVFGNDLVVTGLFYRVDGKVLGGIVKYDGNTWSGLGNARGANALAVYQGQLYAGGTGSPVRWNGASWQTFGTPVYGNIADLHVHGGRLFMGGSITLGTSQPNLVTWDGMTLAPAPGGGANGTVEVLADYGTSLVIGGSFTSIGSVAANRLALHDGKKWSQLGQGVLGAGAVLALAQRAGSLYVGGNFTTYGGNPDAWLLRYDGNRLVPVPGRGDGAVTSMIVDQQLDRLYVSGLFKTAGQKPASYMTAFEFTPQFTDVGAGLAGRNRTPHLEATGLALPARDLRIDLSSARESAPAMLVLGVRRVDVPFLGGVLVPSPDVAIGMVTDRIGRASLGFRVPAGLRSNTMVYAQSWVADPAASLGASASNGLVLRSH